MQLNPLDLKVSIFQAPGQKHGFFPEPDKGVMITHIPTGIYGRCSEYRSAHKNKAVAMRQLAGRVEKLTVLDLLPENLPIEQLITQLNLAKNVLNKQGLIHLEDAVNEAIERLSGNKKEAPNMVNSYYVKAVHTKLYEKGIATESMSVQQEERIIASALTDYELMKPKPKFNESDAFKLCQRVITRCGATGIVVKATSTSIVVYLDEPYTSNCSEVEYFLDGKYRDDGGDHSLDLINFELITLP